MTEYTISTNNNYYNPDDPQYVDIYCNDDEQEEREHDWSD